ncbi:MAG TPA: SDR family oxidoreductase [Gracilimonas sp.]|uniref:SDR family NAD(P)-dependent oxidoreductase n=1 Tax=Gracilimonas sp. TaxID=1974203 RepID=UPI002D9DA621|nr:SDR family oxidoreductase [Gracilimonas sp.]
MGKTILITGASRGIGYETSLKLASLGHTVIATARSEEKLKKLAHEDKSKNIIPVAGDLTVEDDIQKITEVASENNSLDGLINNAGAFHREAFSETDLSVFRKLMDVNVFGIVRLTQALQPLLKKGSHVVNISSMSGFQGSLKFGGFSAYAAAKAAVVGLSEVLGAEFANDGIAVNCLCIGAVQTEMLAEAFPGFEAPVSPAQMGDYLSNFVLTGHQFYNGKVLPVALNDPS